MHLLDLPVSLNLSWEQRSQIKPSEGSMVGGHRPISIVLLNGDAHSCKERNRERMRKREKRDSVKIIADLHLLLEAPSSLWLVYFRHSPPVHWLHAYSSRHLHTKQLQPCLPYLHEELLIWDSFVFPTRQSKNTAFNTGSHFPHKQFDSS